MQRVLPDLEPSDATVGVQAINGSSTRWNPAVNEHADLRREASKRDNKHKPTRRRSEVTRRRIGLYSRPHAIAEIDQRTVEARLMTRTRDELTEHVGGHPTAVERLLIERCVVLALKCAQLDIKIMSGEPLTGHDHQHGLAWFNSLRRTLQALGLQPRKPVTNGTDLDGWVRAKSQVL